MEKNKRKDDEEGGGGGGRRRPGITRQEWEIDPSKLIIKAVIARGTFGTVHRGIYDGQDDVEKRDFHCFSQSLPSKDPLLSSELSQSFRHVNHSSSIRRRRPYLSIAEAIFFFLCSTLHNLPVTSSTVRSFMSSNVSKSRLARGDLG